MDSFMAFLRENPFLITSILMLLLVVVAALTLMLLFKVQKLRSQYERLISGVSEQNVEEVLIDYLKSTKGLETRTKALEEKTRSIEAESRTHLQNIGIVRFNAFEGVGGDQSFSIAMLDDSRKGITLTGIFGHADTRVYAKPIEDGISRYTLTPEENEAIAIAVSKIR